MRIGPQQVPSQSPGAVTGPPAAAAAERAQKSASFSVLNDFRYLTDSDKQLLQFATGEVVEPGLVDRTGAASAFTQQLALDRRTGELGPHQEVTGVYLRNAAAALEDFGAGRPGFRNPYSGEVFDKALAWLDAHGRALADIRL